MVFGIFSSGEKFNGYIISCIILYIFTLFSDDVAIRSPYLLDIPEMKHFHKVVPKLCVLLKPTESEDMNLP